MDTLFDQMSAEVLSRETPTLGDVVLSDGKALLNSLEPGSVACIVTDPPYGIAYHSNYYKDRNPHAPISGDWNFQIGSYLAAAERALRPGGGIYLFTRWDVYPLWAGEVPPSLAIKNAIIWDKGNWSSGDLTGNFGFQYEMIMFLTKGRHKIRGKRWPNVWSVPRIPSTKLRMPAEKPVGIYERAIAASSDPGDLVVDTFGGSGTCAEAAIRTGRRFIVCDVDKAMIKMTRERVGLPPLSGLEVAPVPNLTDCPVFRLQPPSPALWGVHPEDIAQWKSASEDTTNAD